MKDNKEHIINELEQLNAQELKKIKMDEIKIPEYFFEEMQANVLKEIKNEAPKTKIFRLAPLAIAASLVLLVAYVLNLNPTTETDYWSSVSNTDLTYYVENNLEDFSEDEILASVTSTDYSILSNSSISNEELSEYLLDSDIDEEEFYSF